MPGIITLTCPTCGGKLQITPDIDRFVCAHCGNEHLINRSGGLISVKPVVQALGHIQRGTDLTAAELAIKRLNDEIASLAAAKTETDRNLAGWQRAIAQARKKRTYLRLAGYAAAATVILLVLAIAAEALARNRLVADAAIAIQMLSLLAFLGATCVGVLTLFLLYSYLSIASPQSLTKLEEGLAASQQYSSQLEVSAAQANEELQQYRSVVSMPR